MANASRSLTPSLPVHEMPLGEKEDFYRHIDRLETYSDGNEERIDDARQQSRNFILRAKAGNTKRPSHPNSTSISFAPSSNPSKIGPRSSTPAPRRPNPSGTLETGITSTAVATTPTLGEKSKAQNPRQLPSSKSFVQDTPQDSRWLPLAGLRRTHTTPGATATSTSFPDSARQPLPFTMTGTSREKSFAKAKSRRKETVPEDQKKLKDLRLFYIPRDRISVRKTRMELAEMHGAVMASNPAEATHIVVDGNLTYEDIKSHISPVCGKDAPIIVTDQWPLQCIQRKSVFLPTHKYRPRGTPTGELAVSTAQELDLLATHIPQASLELKGATAKRKRWDYVSPETTQASDRASGSNEHSIEPLEHQSQEPVQTEAVSSPPQPQPGADEIGNDSSNPSQLQRTKFDFDDGFADIVSLVRAEFKDLPRLEEDGVNTDGEGEEESSDGSDSGDNRYAKLTKKRQKKKSFGEHFACRRGGTKDGDENNPNAETIAVLKKMSEWHTQTNNHWQMTSYRNAITVLEKITDRKITTAEEALKLPCFGPRLSAHLEEIVNTRSLARLDYAASDPVSKVLSLFLGIYGVGKTTADKWIARGFRTLNDLVQKAKLTDSQRLGIDHYEDLNTRIPRAEVTQLGDCVKAEATLIDPAVTLLVGGSYRRGADTSGDIDFIITKAGTIATQELLPFLSKLVDNLWRSGFLTAEVAAHSSAKDSTGSKWHGCCVLPRIAGFNDDDSYRPIWRRIDFLLVPESEYGAALIYFTGNDIFNRSLRLLAARKGMRLNQRGLYKDVMRGADRAKVTECELVEGRDEKIIFEILKVKWREPSQRWC